MRRSCKKSAVIRTSIIRNLALTLAANGVLCACSPAVNEAEFVQACLTGPAQLSNEEMCKCAASEAKRTVPPHLYELMVLDMQGRKQEVTAAADKMTFDEQATFASQQLAVLQACTGDE